MFKNKCRISIDKIIESIAFDLYQLKICQRCKFYSSESEIRYLHPLISVKNGDKYMCSKCYDEIITKKQCTLPVTLVNL